MFSRFRRCLALGGCVVDQINLKAIKMGERSVPLFNTHSPSIDDLNPRSHTVRYKKKLPDYWNFFVFDKKICSKLRTKNILPVPVLHHSRGYEAPQNKEEDRHREREREREREH